MSSPHASPVPTSADQTGPIEMNGSSSETADPQPAAVTLRSVADFRRAATPGSRWRSTNYLHPNFSGIRVITGGTRVLKYSSTTADGRTFDNGSQDVPRAHEVQFDGPSVHFLAEPGDSDRVAFTWTLLAITDTKRCTPQLAAVDG